MKQALILESVIAKSWLKDSLSAVFPSIGIEFCTNYSQSINISKKAKPDLIIIDIDLPQSDGFTLISEVRRQFPEAFVVVFTSIDDKESIFSAMRLGVNGYLLKDIQEIEFIEKMRDIEKGAPPLSPKVSRHILRYFLSAESTTLRYNKVVIESLSAREEEVLRLVCKGYTRRETAKLLGLAESTIATHVRHIYEKLHINNRAEAVLEAQRLGLIG